MKIMVLTLACALIMLSPSFSGQTSPPLFYQPALITSAGQNAEVQMVAVLAKRAGISHNLNKMAVAEDLFGIKSLILVLGASLKGLGAAGLDTTKEMERVRELVAAAEEKKIPLLCFHLGGEERRGAQSDEFIKAFLPKASMAIVVKSGNKDGFFTRLCQEHGVRLVEVEKIVEALEPLKTAFGLK
ncbi:MAG: DUF6305 family protein [Candidatus Aminicenantales bacterium]